MTLFLTTSRLHRPPFLFLHLLFLLTLTAALQGCGGETPSAVPSSTRFDTGETQASCPNAELAGYKLLVHVATSGADSDSCGDRPASACASIAQGIARCAVAGCAVLVQHGLYPTTASITLRDAVNVHGSCRFGDEPERHYRTVVAAAPAPGTPAVDASGINSATALTGLVVLGKNETVPGEASIAMRVSASKGLTMTGVTLVSGRGGDGTSGVSSVGAPGGNGGKADGFALGGQACPSGQPLLGGNGGAGSSFSNFAFDRSSCLFECNCTALPSSSSPDTMAGQASGQARGGGSGVAGLFGGACSGRGSRSPAPTDGTAGAAGELGGCSSLGGKADNLPAGRFVAGRWLAGRGSQGGAGSTGSGGGGGGAGGYSMFIHGINDFLTYSGFPGGGGGGGGCGAPESNGGQQGGASIPLVMANASIAGLSTDVSLVPGPGGSGGAAAGGGSGGQGGAGGDPYQATRISWAVDGQNVYMPGAGAPGGAGGQGGAGAGGAGGNGGPSFGIALIGNSPDPGHGAIYPGTPGAAGRRGVGAANPAIANNINSGCRSADGEDGLPAATAPVMRFEEQS
jgi:hypothetical protein